MPILRSLTVSRIQAPRWLAPVVFGALAVEARAQSAWIDLGQSLPGSAGAAQLVAHGPLAGGTQAVLELTHAPSASFAFLVAGFAQVDLPLAGGLLVPAPDFVSPALATGSAGQVVFPIAWPADLGSGVSAYFQWWLLDAGAPQGLAASNALVGTSESSISAGSFAPHWVDGLACGSDPVIQIQQFDPDTYILRQSLCTKYEAPFLYLLFGEDKVLMQDTGDGGIPIGTTVQSIVQSWLAAHGKTSIELIVSHSHSHGDHVAGDNQFQGQSNTTVVGLSLSAVKSFFGLTQWPEGSTAYDLGGRIVDVLPIPGHQTTHIALYDRRTAVLFTGDTLYPGRLYISDFPAYRASLTRLVQFTDERPIAWVLGTHIEMSATPGVDFPLGSQQHPDEHVLQLTRSHLLELRQAVEAMAAAPHQEVHADFIVYPLN